MPMVFIHLYVLHHDLITQQSIMEEEFKQTSMSKQKGCWHIVASGIPQLSVVIIQHSAAPHTLLSLSTALTSAS